MLIVFAAFTKYSKGPNYKGDSVNIARDSSYRLSTSYVLRDLLRSDVLCCAGLHPASV